MSKQVYMAIDLKSFYASCECVERGLAPLSTNLVVADGERTEKTICLAVSPSLKALGVPSRPRLFEVITIVNAINRERQLGAKGRRFIGECYDANLLKKSPSLSVGYITATPRMSLYIEYSTKIYGIYLKYFSPDDIHVYSIDEVFIDITNYTKIYKKAPRELAMQVIHDVLKKTGITATVGIGTNLYLAKVAMDIMAKKMQPDKNGVRIAELDEMSYREFLWEHKPITDFWRVGQGYGNKLASHGIYTMGDVALASIYNEDMLYKLFGINAELLIDHAWGYEPTSIKDIKSYTPKTKSLSTGQVLSCPYEYRKAKLIVREMCDLFVLELVEKGIKAKQMTLMVGYDCENLKGNSVNYTGDVTVDFYGRMIPKHARGTANFNDYTSSTREITSALLTLFDKIVNSELLVRRINISASQIAYEHECNRQDTPEQLDFFTDYENREKEMLREAMNSERERREQKAVIKIRKKFGKNAILRGMNFEEGGTTIERNRQIGGHRA